MVDVIAVNFVTIIPVVATLYRAVEIKAQAVLHQEEAHLQVVEALLAVLFLEEVVQVVTNRLKIPSRLT